MYGPALVSRAIQRLLRGPEGRGAQAFRRITRESLAFYCTHNVGMPGLAIHQLWSEARGLGGDLGGWSAPPDPPAQVHWGLSVPFPLWILVRGSCPPCGSPSRNNRLVQPRTDWYAQSTTRRLRASFLAAFLHCRRRYHAAHTPCMRCRPLHAYFFVTHDCALSSPYPANS